MRYVAGWPPPTLPSSRFSMAATATRCGAPASTRGPWASAASATAPGIARSTEAADIPDTARIGRTTGTTGYTAMTGNTGRTGAIATTTTEWTMVSDPECPTPYQLRASHQRTAAQGFFHRTECNGR